MPGSAVPMTVWNSNVPSVFSDIKPRLLRTDYGVVGIMKPSMFTAPTLRAWGPAGTFVWDSNIPQDGRVLVATYNDDDIVVVSGFMSGNYHPQRLSATDGGVLSNGPLAHGLYKTGTTRPLDAIWHNGGHQGYLCSDNQFLFARYAKSGALVPYDAKQPAMGTCYGDTTQLRLAGVGETIAVFYNLENELYFRRHLCP